MIDPKQYFKKIGVISALFLVVMSLSGWVTPINMDEDHIGTGDGQPCSSGEVPTSGACNTLALTVVGEVDRCDAIVSVFSGRPPNICHRRNLVWKLGSTSPLTEWDPDLDGDTDWRFPTIKELSRLMDYGVDSPLGSGSLIENIVFGDGFITESDIWLISSTYRDIDGKGESVNDQNSQILGIHVTTGEIAAFNTEGSRNAFSGTVTGAALKQCTSLDSDGVCSTDDAAVYALVVRVETVDELLP